MRWKHPTGTRSAYQFSYRQGADSWTTRSISRTSTSRTVSNLACNTTYAFAIRTGRTSGGMTRWSSWAIVSSAKTSACTAVRVGSVTRFGNSAITSPRGLAWDGRNLYMVDDATDALYTLNRTTGRATRVRSSTRQFGASITNPRGLAWDGTSLYMITSTALYKLNRATGVAARFGSSTFPSTVTNPSGIAWDGQRLFMVDAGTDSLYRIDTSQTDTGSAVRVGRLTIPIPLPARVVSDPAGLAWVGSTNTLYMAGDNPDALYTIDRRRFSTARFKSFGTTTDVADIEWVGTTMYAVDNGTDALYTIPGVPSSAPTRTLAASYLPSEGDLYYNGGKFADAFLKWDNPRWRTQTTCDLTRRRTCSTYEHDLTVDLTWYVSPEPHDSFLSRVAAQRTGGYCSTWSNLPVWYNDCATAGIPTSSSDTPSIPSLEDIAELSFGSFEANRIASNRYYYGSWTFSRHQYGALNTTSVRLHGQEGYYPFEFRIPILNRYVCPSIWCIIGINQGNGTLLTTNWTRGTANYKGFKR